MTSRAAGNRGGAIRWALVAAIAVLAFVWRVPAMARALRMMNAPRCVELPDVQLAAGVQCRASDPPGVVGIILILAALALVAAVVAWRRVARAIEYRTAAKGIRFIATAALVCAGVMALLQCSYFLIALLPTDAGGGVLSAVLYALVVPSILPTLDANLAFQPLAPVLALAFSIAIMACYLLAHASPGLRRRLPVVLTAAACAQLAVAAFVAFPGLLVAQALFFSLLAGEAATRVAENPQAIWRARVSA